MYKLTKEETEIFKKLNTPKKIQNFLNNIPINFDYQKDTCMSPRMVLRKNKCHCIEGAIFAAAVLKSHGYKPLIVDLEANNKDYDHIITVFKKDRCWGAISKTNHAVLRYRDPVYKSIRELVMSYFHEYTDKKRRKNLRAYSLPVNLNRFDKLNWTTLDEDVWFIPEYLLKVKHFKLVNKKQVTNLNKAHRLVKEIDKIVEWSPGKIKSNKFKIQKL